MAYAAGAGYELWKTNGTTAGTVMVKDIRAGNFGSSPVPLSVMDGKLYLIANDGTNGSELWKTDGTDSGTVLVKDIAPGSDSSNPQRFSVVMGSNLYFAAANSSASGQELWKSDGTDSGTVLVKEVIRIVVEVDGVANGVQLAPSSVEYA